MLNTVQGLDSELQHLETMLDAVQGIGEGRGEGRGSGDPLC